MKLLLLLMLEPQQVLVWTCVTVFILTSAITLLGIIKKVDIDPEFLNKLFVALILEIVAIAVLAFKDSFKPTPVNAFAKIVIPATGYSVGLDSVVYINAVYKKSEKEDVKIFLRANNQLMQLANYSKEVGVYNTSIDSSLLDKKGTSTVLISVINDEKSVISDSIILKK